MTIIKIDLENNSSEWDYTFSSAPLSSRERYELVTEDEVRVDGETAHAFKEWAKTQPGWNSPDAPLFALHPVTIEESDS